MMDTKKTSTGLEENVAGLLCYVGWWVSGIVFLLLEHDNKFVRFHAIQSIVSLGFINLVGWVLRFLPIVGGWISNVVWLLGIALWIVMMVKAYQGVKYRLPIAGDLAEKWADHQPTPPQPPASP
jgi:uncharacterized membrane protein